METELMICQCGDPSHQLIIYYDDDVNMPTVYVAVHLSPETNFFKRLWRGIKYVFSNKRSKYGDFDEIILKPEDAYKLEKAVELLKSTRKNKIEYPLIMDVNQIPS